jgi:hypothetical protein
VSHKLISLIKTPQHVHLPQFMAQGFFASAPPVWVPWKGNVLSKPLVVVVNQRPDGMSPAGGHSSSYHRAADRPPSKRSCAASGRSAIRERSCRRPSLFPLLSSLLYPVILALHVSLMPCAVRQETNRSALTPQRPASGPATRDARRPVTPSFLRVSVVSSIVPKWPKNDLAIRVRSDTHVYVSFSVLAL